jgi:Rrf2 family transcriptional regulator, iron-sulfur cluster assembly transcription factor
MSGARLLPRTTEYALRLMAHFGGAGRGQVLRAEDLARASNTPPAYVAKVLRRLAKHRLLVSTKGHGGGFMLALEPAHVRLLDVIVALDSIEAAHRCAFGWGACDPEHPCSLHTAWVKLREAFLHWAASTTVADIAADPRLLSHVDRANPARDFPGPGKFFRFILQPALSGPGNPKKRAMAHGLLTARRRRASWTAAGRW